MIPNKREGVERLVVEGSIDPDIEFIFEIVDKIEGGDLNEIIEGNRI